MRRGGYRPRRKGDIRLEFVHPSRWEVWIVIWIVYYIGHAYLWTLNPFFMEWNLLVWMAIPLFIFVLPTALITYWVRSRL